MKNFDQLPEFIYFQTLDEMPQDFTGKFGIPREHFYNVFYVRYPKYWEIFEMKGSVRSGVLSVEGEPLEAIVLMDKKAIEPTVTEENTPENP